MTDKMREEFEAWAKDHLIYGDDSEDVEGFRLDMESSYYLWTETQAAWEAWQASRAALVVELPYPAVTGSELYRGHAVREAIESAGVTVK